MKKIKRAAIIAPIIASLSGCIITNGKLENVNFETSTQYTPIGIPLLLGGNGSYVPITKNLSLTAAHVAKLNYTKIVETHPVCDLAIIETNNQATHKMAEKRIKSQGKTRTDGFNLFGQHKTGTGKYFGDVVFQDSDLVRDCVVSITSAPVTSGMSGGPVTNEKNEVVGTIVGISEKFKPINESAYNAFKSLKSPTVFIDIVLHREWIDNVIFKYQKQKNKMKLAPLTEWKAVGE